MNSVVVAGFKVRVYWSLTPIPSPMERVINVYNESFLKRFGENLREVREKKELSQRQLAELAKIDFTQIGRIERGEINTTLSTIYTIAKALEVHPAKLLTFEFKEK